MTMQCLKMSNSTSEAKQIFEIKTTPGQDLEVAWLY